MTACAFMTTMFDIEILATDSDLKVDLNFGGLGSQQPATKLPFRIRRRQDKSQAVKGKSFCT